MEETIVKYRIVENKGTKTDWMYIAEGNKKRAEDRIRDYAFENDLKVEYKLYSLCDFDTTDYE